MVPYPHLMQLINPVELILYPGRLRPHYATEPHVRIYCRVQVIRIQSRTVDSIFRPFIEAVGAGSGSRYILDGISDRLDRKAPEFAFIDGEVGWRVNLVDPPVIGLPKLDKTGRVICVSIQVLTDQYAQPIRSAGIVDIV